MTTADRLAFVHRLLRGDMTEARMFLPRIERLTASLSVADRLSPDVAAALDAIASDGDAKARFVAFMQDAEPLSTRVRLLDVARSVGWYTSDAYRAELARMIGAVAASNAVSPADVDLVCRLGDRTSLAAGDVAGQLGPAQSMRLGASALLACLGDPDSHQRMLFALTSPDERDVQLAQVYVGHRPIDDVGELREVAMGVTRMPASAAQVRALDALAALRLSDPESLEAIARLFPVAQSPGVQKAIAGVLIRADAGVFDRPLLAETLRRSRLKASAGDDLIDVLIRRLEVR